MLPKLANKGNALAFACEAFGLTTSDAAVAGDTGNDASMFLQPGVRRIVMHESRHELHEAVADLPHFHATQHVADGVIEGLHHFGLW